MKKSRKVQLIKELTYKRVTLPREVYILTGIKMLFNRMDWILRMQFCFQFYVSVRKCLKSDHLHVWSAVLVNRKDFISPIPVIQEFPTDTKQVHTKIYSKFYLLVLSWAAFPPHTPKPVLSKSIPDFRKREALSDALLLRVSIWYLPNTNTSLLVLFA